MGPAGSVEGVRCPRCSGLDDKVVDSRAVDDGSATRRRRECLSCHQRFTTYERLDEVPMMVVKRSGQREPFDASKIVAGLRAASKNRPVSAARIEALATEVEEALRLEGPEVASGAIGRAVLQRLRDLDEVAYLRFASVYKGFTGPEDFRREMGLLEKDPDSAPGPVTP
jgi:transcriptional repressor NrdR